MKQVWQSDKHFVMGHIRRGWVCGAVLVIATLSAKSAPTESSYPIRAVIGGDGTAPASAALFADGDRKDAGLVLAQMLPFERNKVEPIDVRQAFVEGYEAYQRRDYLAVIGRMQLVSASVPDLADYALFYLGAAQRKNGDWTAAADSFRRLVAAYPQSVLADAAGIAYAKVELRLGHPDYALAEATRVANTSGDPVAVQNARLVMAQALVATNDFGRAYRQAQAVREEFPSGPADPQARALAYQILNSHPAVAARPSLDYHRAEAAILLREGQAALALGQIHAGLQLKPSDNVRAELSWMLAEASRGNPAAAKAALMQCLEVAPAGTHAPAALDTLAHLYWRADDTVSARTYFNRILREFPQGRLAPEAMFEIGRTYEDDGAFAAARTEYLALLKRYAGSEVVADARFRAPFMLYMLRHYDGAATEFGTERARAPVAGGERDMFAYWEARALERAGKGNEARERFRNVARSVTSNYYPALAGMRVNVGPEAFPAAHAPELVETALPDAEGSAGFHIRRVLALRELGLRGLEPAELRALEPHSAANPVLRDFMLEEMLAAGAWHDAIQSATTLSERGALDPLVAERIRYPRGYWEMVSSAATRNDLDPYLVAALIRQESLYDPDARSGSDARGLMQLLPSTADRYAAAAGVPAPLDLYDPGMSVRLGTTYLRQLFAMFDGNMFRAVAAYNGGEHAVAGWVAKYPGDDDQWVENIGFRETRDYVKKVVGGMREYRLLYPAAPATSPSAVSASAASSSTPPL